MIESIQSAGPLKGPVQLPGDKSISHRYAMIASLANGVSTLHNYSTGADCHSTLACMRDLGVTIEVSGTDITVNGVGLDGLKGPGRALDAGNSGTAIRMLSGILAAQKFNSEISGDESVNRRPMGRVITPLAQMGARITAKDGRFPPLLIEGTSLHPIDYTLPVASAQVKSCVMLAGLFCDGDTIVREPVVTRDHTEIALREFGADVDSIRGVITLKGRPELTGRELRIPGDISSSAFFLVAAILVPGSRIVIQGVGLNPTRSSLLDFLAGGGARIRIPQMTEGSRELMGDIVIEHGPWKGGVLEKGLTAALIDEIPVLSVLGAMSEHGLVVRDAAELRVKETDRIATVAENMKRMGITMTVHENGFEIPGKQKFRAAEVDSFGDHRIAMAFAVAALAADGESKVHGAEAASVSFPEFYNLLRTLRG